MLERVVAIAESAMDAARPSDQENPCPFCTERATEAPEHAQDCAYRIARTLISPADLQQLRRLAQLLRYETRL